jgi:hypothetical protein
MNDDELMTAVRESFTDLHSATPVERIVSRSRSRTVRARRRIPVLAGALGGAAAVAGAAALAVTALPAGHVAALPASHQPGHAVSAKLAAWTVARQADGDIDVTIKQLDNPAGLQSTLRADGLPVNVSFSSPLSAACQPYNASKDALRQVAGFQSGDGSAFLVIDPSALPNGTGVAIFDDPGAGIPRINPHTLRYGNPPPGSPHPSPPAGITGPLAVGLVYASQQCTG